MARRFHQGIGALAVVAVAMPAIVMAGGSTTARPAPCRLVSFEGEVRDNEAFSREIGEQLSFKMRPHGESQGWRFEIGPTSPQARPAAPKETEFSGYVYALSPPYRSNNVQYVDTSYAVPAQEAASIGPREFWFITSRSQAELASRALSALLWHDPDMSQNQALAQLDRLSRGRGVFTVMDADIRPAPEPVPEPSSDPDAADVDYGEIHRLHFRVELNLPIAFEPAGGLAVQQTSCPDSTWWPFPIEP